MKSLHWILFAIGVWIATAPFFGDDILALFLPQITFSEAEIINLLRWDDLFLGAAVLILALLAVTREKTSKRKPGIKAMHWIQTALGFWTAILPFAVANLSYRDFAISHLVTGLFIAIFALVQITGERK